MTTFPIIPYDRLPAPFSTHPYLLVLTPAILLVLGLLTRVVTTINFYSHRPQSNRPAPLPYSFPYIAHVPAMAALPDYITKQSRRHPTHPAFTLTLGSSKQHVLVAPSLTHQLLTKRDVVNKINMHAAVFRMVSTSWGDHKEEMRKTIDEDIIFGPVHGVLKGMMREEFVTPSLTRTTAAVAANIQSMISGLPSIIDMPRWERTAAVEITYPNPNDKSAWVAEANLFYLMRDFVGDLTTGVLMGNDFASNFPNILDDVWTMDPMLIPALLGLPEWISPTMLRGANARGRVFDAVREHHTAYLKHVRGEDPGARWGNMDDVSSVMRNRVLAWDEAGASIDVAARGDVAVFWAMNVNAPVVIFWMVWYIFSNPALLKEIREEISPYFKIRNPDSAAVSGFKEQPKVEIDLDGLRKKCPLLQGTFMETTRLETAGTSFKYLSDDIVLEESEEDALLFGRAKDDRQKYILKKGEYVVVPHSFHQNDERYFENPQTFDARRFWVRKHQHSKNTEKEDASEDEITVSYKTMKPWGGGNEICKGRKFAEGEVVLFAAAVVMFWDMEPVDEKPWYAGLGEDVGGVLKIDGKKGTWKHPGHSLGAGALQPKRMGECRVRMWRREVLAE